jgi:hypothetical protein
MGVSENYKGLILAVCSSGFIGASFILKKKGLKRAVSRGGTRAGSIHLFSSFDSILERIKYTLAVVATFHVMYNYGGGN